MNHLQRLESRKLFSVVTTQTFTLPAGTSASFSSVDVPINQYNGSTALQSVGVSLSVGVHEQLSAAGFGVVANYGWNPQAMVSAIPGAPNLNTSSAPTQVDLSTLLVGAAVSYDQVAALAPVSTFTQTLSGWTGTGQVHLLAALQSNGTGSIKPSSGSYALNWSVNTTVDSFTVKVTYTAADPPALIPFVHRVHGKSAKLEPVLA